MFYQGKCEFSESCIIMPQMIKKFLKIGLRVVFTIKKKFFSSAPPSDLHDVKSIVIFGNTGLGNIILMTPFIKTIQQTYPQAQICMLTDKTWIADILEEHIEIIPVTMRNRFFSVIHLIKTFIKLNPDITFYSYLYPNQLLLIVPLLFTKFSVCHKSGDGWENLLEWAFDFLVPNIKGEHETKRMILLLSYIKNKIIPDMQPHIKVENILNLNMRDMDRPIITFHPGSSAAGKYRRWPPERYWETCHKLLKIFNGTCIFVGGKDDEDLIPVFENFYKSSTCENCKKIKLWINKFSLKDTVNILMNSDLFIGNDSGVAHLSAVLGIPTIVIWGPADIKRTRPLGEKVHIIREKTPCAPCETFEKKKLGYPSICKTRICLMNISTSEVTKIAKSLLETYSKLNSQKD